MQRDAIRGKVQTVRGPISPEILGRTLMHEHLVCDIRPPSLRTCECDRGPITLENVWAINYGEMEHAPSYVLDMPEVMVEEVGAWRARSRSCRGARATSGGPHVLH